MDFYFHFEGPSFSLLNISQRPKMMLPRNLAVLRAVLLILLQTERPFAEQLSSLTGLLIDEPVQKTDLKNNERSATNNAELLPSNELNKEAFSLQTNSSLSSSFLLRSLVKRDGKGEKLKRPEFLKSNGTLSKFGRSNNSTAPVPFKRHEVYTYIIYFSRVLYALVCIGKLLNVLEMNAASPKLILFLDLRQWAFAEIR